ncbi:hypothetical protein CJ030_MR5G004853 [Morella rubra]|uniref:RNase H type-1 domain-containing protein n=1 Tax=Morella rubra TaxID=262757 RepID=A0A6A1VSR5_9ROSI|nr:hypothetical protein CJ030_MR5G004853 [Morella rubra]
MICLVFSMSWKRNPLSIFSSIVPRLCWRESPWGLQTLSLRDRNIHDWITTLLNPVASLDFLDDHSNQLIRYGAILMDVIWFSRNQLLHQGKRDDVCSLIRRIHRLFVEHSIAWTAVSSEVLAVWSPPCGNFWKFNFDVAIRPACSMLAVVCRNSDGLLLFAWTKRLPPGTPLVGEARAALFAVQEACLLSYPLVVFQGDNLQVCRTLSQADFSPDWSIDPIICDIQALLEAHASWSFSHVRRGANLLAHNVAKWAVNENLDGSIPPCCIPFDILCYDNPPTSSMTLLMLGMNECLFA